MKKSSIAFLAAVALAGSGCHKDKAGESLAKMTELKDKMCACKDKACSDKVSNELSGWTQEQAKSAGGKPVTPSEDPKMEAVIEAMTSCMLKLEIPAGGGAAGPAGAAGGSGAAAPAAGSADGAAAAGSADGSAAHGW